MASTGIPGIVLCIQGGFVCFLEAMYGLQGVPVTRSYVFSLFGFSLCFYHLIWTVQHTFRLLSLIFWKYLSLLVSCNNFEVMSVIFCPNHLCLFSCIITAQWRLLAFLKGTILCATTAIFCVSPTIYFVWGNPFILSEKLQLICDIYTHAQASFVGSNKIVKMCICVLVIIGI